MIKYNFDKKYRIAQLWVNRIFRLNFRKIVFVDTANIPKDKPIIFAPSHKNALLDALIFVYTNIKKQVVFLARADIFKNPTTAKILTFTRILPVYRIRDGKDNLSKNSQVFEECGKLLQNRNPICLFPEGVYNPHQSLLKLKKAIPKIALPTESKNNFELDTHIVPVALHYTDKHGYLSDLYITYCEPIRVADYKDLYLESENKAFNKMRNDMDTQLRKKVVDIPVDEYYDERLAYIEYHAEKLSKEKFDSHKAGIVLAKQKLVADLKELEENEPLVFEEKMQKIRLALKRLKKHNFSSISLIPKVKSIAKLTLNFLLLLFIAPFALLGLLNSVIPIIIYRILISKIKDKQFISSIRVVVGILLVPIIYMLQALAVGLICKSFIIGLVYIILSPITLYFGSYWRKWWKENWAYGKINTIQKKSPLDWNLIISAFK